jgi:hypothetical protein
MLFRKKYLKNIAQSRGVTYLKMRVMRGLEKSYLRKKKSPQTT